MNTHKVVKSNPVLRHVAIIPDGNRRWAKQKGAPSLFGHKQGYERVQECISFAREMSIEFITIWAFSTENWKRTQEEVGDLMSLLVRGFSELHANAKKEKARVVHIGRRDRLGDELISLINKVEEETKEYKDFCICIAIDYGGEDEIQRAEQRWKEVSSTEKSVLEFLDTSLSSIPPLDLVIRTGGEKRTSGFMPLQGVYAEWVFEEKLFPDFDKQAFQKALVEYSERQRRFGK